MIKKWNIAIAGLGPRGLNALENLIAQLNKTSIKNVHIFLFEETSCKGNGPVYNTNQSETNWINISERVLHLRKRDEVNLGEINIPSFPSYHAWANIDYSSVPDTHVDVYPPRSKIGAYLQQRFESILEPLQERKVVTLTKARVDKVSLENGGAILETEQGVIYTVDEVLLTIGHQPTKDSEQITNWKSYADNHPNVNLFTEPYPISQFNELKELPANGTIAIRGFGLAMIDVVRGIAEKFGGFIVQNSYTRKVSYQTKHKLSDLFVPFSLDGLPVSPKPLNKSIDDWFKPTNEQMLNFESTIGDKQIQKEANNHSFLINAMVPLVVAIYSSLSKKRAHGSISSQSLGDLVRTWLLNDDFQHPLIISKEQSAKQAMQDYIGMATGMHDVSLDFCTGQVWRHCQPSIYDKLSFNECSENVIAQIIKLDERMKRYAYGPPVESVQQLVALISAGIINLDLANNPEIELTSDGWCLSTNETVITANVMIDSVLDSPKLLQVESPIIKCLLENEAMQSVHDDLGVLTNENGYVISELNGEPLPLAILGRLAKGTIIGVDAILECFGKRPKLWAIKAVKNIKKGNQK